MKNSTQLLRRILATFLVVLISINSFAAVVGDNDGAAFITKAEFESLKNDFQSQINRYNSSLDTKIDGAIASYISGLKIDIKPTDLWALVTKSIGQPMRMRNRFDLGTDTTTTSVNLNFSRYLDIYEATNLSNGLYVSYNRDSDGNIIGLWRIETRLGTSSSGGGTNSHFYGYADFGGYSSSTMKWGYTTANSWTQYDDWVLLDQARRGATNWWSNDYSYSYSYGWRRYQLTNSSAVIGTGARWVYHQNPDGNRYLMTYNTRYGTSVTGEIIYKKVLAKTPWNINGKPGHSGSKNPDSFAKYMADNTRSDDTTQTVNAQLGSDDVTTENVVKLGLKTSVDGKAAASGGTRSGTARATVVATGESSGVDSTDKTSYYWQLNYSTEQNSDGIDYTIDQWGRNSSNSLYCNRDIEGPTKGTATTYNVARNYFNNVYASLAGWKKQTNYLGQLQVTLNPATFGVTTAKASSFINTYLTAVSGETVYIGGGIPIAKANNPSSDITISGKFIGVSGTGSADNVSYIISDKQFKENAVDTANGGRSLASGTIRLNTTFSHKVEGIPKDGILWINFYDATTSGAVVTMDNVKVE